MPRLAFVFCVLSWAACGLAQNLPSSDAFALSLAQKSVLALTGGAAIGDVTLNGNVIQIFGSDNESGTGIFKAKGTGESRVDLSLSGGNRSDVRNYTTGSPSGAWNKNGGAAAAYSQHNCWTDASWFFPALSSLTQTATPNFVFRYIAQEQHNGVPVQHIRVFQSNANDNGTLQKLTTMDFYLALSSNLPLAVASTAHADNDMNTNLATEVRFANYQPVNGIQVPFHFQSMINGGVVLDVTVTNVVFNTGLPDTLFTLQ